MPSDEPTTRLAETVVDPQYPATITRHAQAVALLNDPDFTVELVREAPQGPLHGVGWLRSTVSRFAAGPAHARRRALVEEHLARLDPADLRERAHQLSSVDDGAAPGAVVVTVLAQALGIDADVALLVAAIAPAYFPGSTVDPAADAAVDALVTIVGGRYDEESASIICLLVQAHHATARLVTNATGACRTHGIVHDGQPMPEALLVEVLRHDPPVTSLRRLGPEGIVTVDVRAVNHDPAVFDDAETFDPYRSDATAHLTFGAGPRSCPGAAHALAMAAGMLHATT